MACNRWQSPVQNLFFIWNTKGFYSELPRASWHSHSTPNPITVTERQSHLGISYFSRQKVHMVIEYTYHDLSSFSTGNSKREIEWKQALYYHPVTKSKGSHIFSWITGVLLIYFKVYTVINMYHKMQKRWHCQCSIEQKQLKINNHTSLFYPVKHHTNLAWAIPSKFKLILPQQWGDRNNGKAWGN